MKGFESRSERLNLIVEIGNWCLFERESFGYRICGGGKKGKLGLSLLFKFLKYFKFRVVKC